MVIGSTPRDAPQRVLAGRRALLLLDGTEQADDLQQVLAIRDQCGVLVTSRRHEDAVADLQDIAPLPLDEAVKLLQAWAGQRAADQSTASKICALVGGLPLAVRLVGRYLAQRQQQAATYLAWLQASPLQAVSQGERRAQSVSLLLERSLVQVSEAARQALTIAREIGDPRGEGANLGSLGNADYDLGQVEKARPYLTEALAICEEIKSPSAEQVRKDLARLEGG